MKIVLTAINAKYIHSNLAVYCLKEYASKWKEQIEIAEFTINQQEGEILSALYEKKPDILAFSCYIWNITFVRHIAAEFHKLCPQVPIVAGGPEVSYDAAGFLKENPAFSLIMRGEGEKSFLALLDCAFEGAGEISEINGIVYRGKDGAIHENPWESPIDLSTVPFPYEQMKAFTNKIIYYETSRGCPFSCSYCLSSIDKKVRFRNLELVKRELQFFLDEKVPQVKFVDRTFNCSHEHAYEIWNYIREHDNGVTNFHFEISADLLNEKELELMRGMRPGLIQLEIGVQSVNPQTIEEIHRKTDIKKLGRIVGDIYKFGNIHRHLDLIAGLPYEGYESFQTSFNEVYAMKPEQLQLGFLKVLKGSYMEAHSKEYGLLYQNEPPYEVLQTNWLRYDEIVRLKEIEEMVEVYGNSAQFNHTMKELVKAFESPFQMFEKLARFYKEREYFKKSHSRIARYEILLQFICQWDQKQEQLYKELLTLDLYLRENLKNRPSFFIEKELSKEAVRSFYQTEEKEHRYLRGYDGFSAKQLVKMTHLEIFQYDVLGTKKRGTYPLLFDYKNRMALNGEAAIFQIEMESVNEKENERNS